MIISSTINCCTVGTVRYGNMRTSCSVCITYDTANVLICTTRYCTVYCYIVNICPGTYISEKSVIIGRNCPCYGQCFAVSIKVTTKLVCTRAYGSRDCSARIVVGNLEVLVFASPACSVYQRSKSCHICCRTYQVWIRLGTATTTQRDSWFGLECFCNTCPVRIRSATICPHIKVVLCKSSKTC